MGIWGWVQAIATGWFVLSILLAVAWALGGRRIFRKPPQPPKRIGLVNVVEYHEKVSLKPTDLNGGA